ncbi:MAG: hypothetical protein SPJ23_09625 [Eubacteriales bacterium]|nr:hypothetical protein [Eubacteriales bacterium]
MRYEIVLSDITLSPDVPEEEACAAARRRFDKARLRACVLQSSVYRCSVDARRKSNVRLVRSVLLTCEGELPDREHLAALHGALYSAPSLPTLMPEVGDNDLPTVVVGMGPAGLFCALLLAERGMRPILIERGAPVRERIALRDRFYATGELDSDCNVQFGAGGAGTFSDGKLVTRVNDPHCALVLELLARFGAPPDILRRARPHVGTDLLPGIIENAAAHILSLGGTILYRTRLTGFSVSRGRVNAVVTQNGELPCSACVLATGHSARDVYDLLPHYGIRREPKPFSVGVRIEHLTEEIDRAMYGSLAGHPALGHAEYSLSHRVSGRGVYTFCMCPGGEVVCGSTEEGGVVTNGMSKYARDGVNSNSAIAVSVFPEDVGGTPDAAVAFQRSLEQAAFRAGGGRFTAPVSTVGDLMHGTSGTAPGRVRPTYMGGERYRTADLRDVLPPFVLNALRGGIAAFGRTLSGFDAKDAVLTAAETRTSAPMRIPRDSERLCVPELENLYPCGEGAGYAGGITSAAADGLKVAEKILAEAVKKR